MAESVEDVLQRPWDLLRQQSSLSLKLRAQVISDIEDRGRAEQRVRLDYSGRYPIELLQNAHDACADVDQVGKAWFHFSPKALLIANQGVPFTAERARALIRLGSGTKTAGDSTHHTIGYKGIGFSAVFEITDNPQVVSSGARFQFHRAKAAERISALIGAAPESLPVRGFPIELADSELGEDAQVINSLLDRGATSVIRLPLLRDSPDEIARAVRAALSPEVLLFMPHLDQIEFSGAGVSEMWQKRSGGTEGEARIIHLAAGAESRAWLVATSREEAPADAVAALDDELWQDVTKLNVAVAIPWEAGRPDPARGSQALHVYFPTRDLLGRAVLVHGDFYVDSSRTRIATNGPAGEISECVGAAAARLLGGLVEQLWEHGRSVIDCLAVTGETDGFGKRMGELIIRDLLKRRFLRALDGTGPNLPRELSRMGQTMRLAQRVGRLLNKSGDLADLSLEELPARGLLVELRMGTIDPLALAVRIDPAASDAPYGGTLDALQEWIESVQQPTTRARLGFALENRCVVRCQQTGAWVRPGAVIHPREGVPSLPAALHKDSVELPDGKHHPLFDTFDIPVLDAARALDMVLEALENGEFGTLERGPAGPLLYLRQLWRSHPEILLAGDRRLPQVLLPVKTLTEPLQQSWCDAGRVYFGPEWLAGGSAAGIYGPLGVPEFLAEEPPRSRKAVSKQLDFFQSLGVSADPQPARVDTINASDVRAWRRSPAYAAAVCPKHERSHAEREADVPERLDDLLRSGNRASLTALAQYLAKQPEPYGKRAEVRCNHRGHGGQRWKSVPSLREFLLRSIPWVPVRSDPGNREFRTPDLAWVLALEAHERYLLPCADLDEATSSALRLPNTGRPQRAALEAGLGLLETLTDEIPDVPEKLWKTAEWLLRGLERTLRDISTIVPKYQGPPLLAFSGKTPIWSSSPLIPDVPGLDALSSIDVLPSGSWPNLRRVYQLTAASDVIAIEVRPDRNGPRPDPLLGESDRVDLVAYLDSAGGGLEDLARLIGRLEQIPCAALQLVLSHEGETAEVNRQYHLERVVEREGRSQVARGRLYTAPDPPLDELSEDLAEAYLQKPALAKDIHLYLLGRQRVLKKLTEEEFAVAAQALLKYPFQTDLIDDNADPGNEKPAATLAPQPVPTTQTGDDGSPAAGSSNGQSASGPAVDLESRGSQAASDADSDGERVSQDRHPRADADAQHGGATNPDAAAPSPRDHQDRGDEGGRNRMVSYIEPTDHEPQSEDPARTARRNAIDRAGVDAVVDFEIRRGRRPVVLPPGHPGYDVTSSGEGADEPDRLIEVKSVDGAWDAFGVGLQPAQFETAQRKRDSYWLYVVEHARTATPIVHTLQDPTAQISSFRLDHKWAALSVESAEVPRQTPDLLSSDEAAQFDDALPVFDYQTIGHSDAAPSGWIRCPGADRDLHFAAILSDRSLEPLAEPGDVVCIKAGRKPEADDLSVLVTIDEQGADGTEFLMSIRTLESEFDDDGSLRAVVLRAREGSGVTPLVVDDPGRLQIHGSFVGVIAGGVSGGLQE